jgi:hypothetical protein
LCKESQETLYGFYRWTSRVDGECLIQLPWYGEGQLKELNLDVSPEDSGYRVVINNADEALYQAENGRITMAIPEILPEPCLQIRMGCPQSRQWELRRFSLS